MVQDLVAKPPECEELAMSGSRNSPGEVVADSQSAFNLVNVRGIQLVVGDVIGSIAAGIIVHELNRDDYGLHAIEFGFGDTVVDIGAHVGIFSMYLARRYPFLSIIALEPAPCNFLNLRRNLQLNGIGNVHVHNLAVTADGRNIPMTIHRRNTGGASGFVAVTPELEVFAARSTTLEAIFSDHGLASCKMLKIDCEGGEHEILRSTTVLPRIEYLSAEFHENGHLRAAGHTVDGLSAFVRGQIPGARLRVTACHMSD